jgi:hypothetical protein
LARSLPTEGTAHAREKRLYRALNNRYLDPRGVTDGLCRIIMGKRGAGLWPILFDQTKAGTTQALVAGVPFEGRALPLAVYTFEYPWDLRVAKSQNEFEHIFLLDIETALPPGVRGVFIGDRGYARAALFRHCEREGRLFIIRGRAGTCVDINGRRIKLGELACPPGKIVRYRNVRYQSQLRQAVDVVAFHDPKFQEPWWLIVPAGSSDLMSDEDVVSLYRQRMRVEHTFRDLKSHIGLRGLKLQVRIAERMGRLLLALAAAYCLAVVLGATEEAQPARQDLEIPRRKPRHGTTRTLSVLTLAMQMLAHPRWRRIAVQTLYGLVELVARGRPLLDRAPPFISVSASAA